jgi:hypothetical protein
MTLTKVSSAEHGSKISLQ